MGFFSKLKADRAKLNELDKGFSFLNDEITKLNAKIIDEFALAEQIERKRMRAENASERESHLKQLEADRKRIADEQLEVDRQRGAVLAIQGENERWKEELEKTERILEQKEDELERKDEMLKRKWQNRNDDLDNELDDLVKDERENIKKEIETIRDENIRLLNSLRSQEELDGAYKQLKIQLGGKHPADVIRELNSKNEEMARLSEELSNRPTDEMRTRVNELEKESRNQKVLIDQYKDQLLADEAAVAAAVNLRHRNSVLEAENSSLAQTASIFELAANTAKEECYSLRIELNRLRTPNERPEEEQKRYKQIEKERIKEEDAKVPKDPGLKKPRKTDYPDDTDAYNTDKEAYNKSVIKHEINWLTKIGDECDKIGLHFNQRILKAFHTALKTADWSLLTILAGVSGTGKSELPRLYSHFGGIYFEELSVQPNWDSKESMLGFFNSIDNKFAAEPVLHFLAQSQMEWEEKTENNKCYPGLIDAVCLILLDEMNLAHPELYFAEFLSKLEKRRGLKGKEKMPDLPVSIGAGMTPYPLKLGRNVLWTGTMNQDETTKSLSDKVLDRSIIIHFPRPTELKRRDEIIPLTNDNRGTILHRKSWESWLTRKSPFSDKDIKPYKDFIEEMNESLSVVGRAIGHRVWQSIEYYIANYPDVRDAMFTTSNDADKEKLTAAMHTAFEDQLAQKVMPKLRGIDTRERSKSKTECLDKILSQLNAGVGGNRFNLADDFNIACGDLGHGQFIWQSANYLNYDPAVSSDGSKNDVD